MTVAVLPWVLGGLGLWNLLQGQSAQTSRDKYLNRAGKFTQLQLREFRRLIDILSNPNSPERRILMDQANRALGGQVSQAKGALVSDLASRGFTDARSLAQPLRLLSERGVAAKGDLERNLLRDFLDRRTSMVSPGSILQGNLGLANIFGNEASGYGQGLGGIIAALTKLYTPNLQF